MSKLVIPPLLATDSYKVSHKGFMVEGTTKIYSNLTPRSLKRLAKSSLFDGKIVVFGISMMVQELDYWWQNHFFNLSKEEAIANAARILKAYIGHDDNHHFEQLHDLGYLPIEIKSLPEGALINERVPVFTFFNTHPDFAWLTNYLETFLSAEVWKPMTVATIARQYRMLANHWALATTGSLDGTEFQVHDFSYRGMSNSLDAARCGAGFLLSTNGTDNIPALCAVEQYYQTPIDSAFIATSVPASEHSLACTGIEVLGELETYRKWITQDYPSGIVSIVSDTFDFFRVVTDYACALKDDILNRIPNELGLAKVVFRPDSGDPVKILTGYTDDEVLDLNNDNEDARYQVLADNRVISSAEKKGAVECLAEIFGTTESAKGYRQLHERVGLIYGDSITLERAELIFSRLAAKGFASTCVVIGVGSYTCQYLTRDTLGIAIKATAAEVNGEIVALSKAPKTDSGEKHSARGLLKVEQQNGEYVLLQNVSVEEEQQGCLETYYKDSKILKQEDFVNIRNRLWNTAQA